MWLPLIDAGSHGGDSRHGRPLEPSAGRLAMWVFLASLAALFAPLLIVFLLMRYELDSWPPEGLRPLPGLLWVSTALIAGLGGVMYAMQAAVDRDRVAALRRMALFALGLALAFLLCQAACWRELFAETIPPGLWRVAGLFYFFSVLHALHIIGGFVPLLFVTRNAFRGVYSRHRSRGVQYCAMYWHFLGFVWLIMFAAIQVPS